MVLVQNVSKRYSLYDRPADRLLDVLPLRSRRRSTDFWAVRDVSFSVASGEILGIVGPNGSGKSTLLQLVSGILPPTSGRISVEGRIAALLELGAGFNPEFSGRENVFLNSEILGLSKRETEKMFPAIAAFAGIGDFIDRPVKEYSSGMYVRLAFATAIHVDPEVLIIDEALAVGDAIFANRCIQKLDELKRRSVTILFVSHDLGIVKRLCHRAILMYKGSVLCEGTPSEVVNRYVGLVHDANAAEDAGITPTSNYRHGDRASTILAIAILNHSGQSTNVLQSGEDAIVRITTRFQRPSEDPSVGILVRNRLGIDVFGTNTRLEGHGLGDFQPGDILTIDFAFPCQLTRNDYTLTVATQNADGTSQDWLDDAVSFTVVDHRDVAGIARINTDVSWKIERGTAIPRP